MICFKKITRASLIIVFLITLKTPLIYSQENSKVERPTFQHWDFKYKNFSTQSFWGLSAFDFRDTLGLFIASTTSNPAHFSINIEEFQNIIQWNFEVEIKGTLSSSNYIRFYLSSSEENFSNGHQGYHVQIDGSNGKHYYKLYKQTGTRRTTIFTSKPFISQPTHYKSKVKITKTKAGLWELYADEYDQGSFIKISAEDSSPPIIENSILIDRYFGTWFNFTITRRNDFTLKSIAITKENKADHEPPPKIERAKYKDIVINEIMANPKGNTQWPDVEFIELYNRSNDTINLYNWSLNTKSAHSLLPTMLLNPNSFLILCAEKDTTLMLNTGNCMGLKKWPTLANTGTTLILKNSNEIVIDSVAYTDRWYSNSLAKQGGISLEKIYLIDACTLDDEWGSSIHTRGATPNQPNSIQIDTIPNLRLSDFKVLDAQSLLLSFNKKISQENDSLLLQILSNARTEEHGHSKKWESENTLLIKSDLAFQTSQDYILVLTNLKSCDSTLSNLEIPLFIPDPINRGDIIISEILFEPYPGGEDFIEVYNRSKKTFNLQNLSIATLNTQGKWSNLNPITDQTLLLKPGEFKVLTKKPNELKIFYPKSISTTFHLIKNLPAFPNDAGYALLINHTTPSGLLIDSLYYSSKMHHQLIQNKKGISLERTNFDLPNNKTLASTPSSEGGATPGYRSSQISKINQNRVHIENPVLEINPSTDEKPILLNYELTESIVHANVHIINFRGQKIKKLISNKTIPGKGEITWDGKLENGKLAPPGIYTFQLEFFNTKGWKILIKKTCILTVNI